MYIPLPLTTFLVVPETPSLDGVAVSPLTLSKSWRRNPPGDLSRIILRCPEHKKAITPSLATLERAVSA